ncbi:MAG: hypothetical protein HC896_05860 [Bacteroidales bacterium]|nr:hypothetical protein [Bacteroidales bacterium]
MSLSKILSIVLYIVMGISVVMVGAFYFGGTVTGTEGTTFEEPVITDLIIKWSYVLVIIAGVSAVIFPLAFMIANPSTAKKTLASVVVLGVVVVVAYFLASDQPIIMPGFEFSDAKVLKMWMLGCLQLTCW